MLSYLESLEYLNSFINYEKKISFPYNRRSLNLERTRKLLSLLGNPQDNLNFIHIAGTKGKGSVSAMITSVLKAAGFKTGLYTSPHLISPRERIRIGEKLISKNEFAYFLSLIKSKIEKLIKNFNESPTFFEIYTALALIFFAYQKVDFAVLEVGLGGRLDATNVVSPLVGAITQISFDHTQILGKSLSLIAKEKAGIIKKKMRMVTSPQEEEALSVIRKTCKEKGIPLYEVGKEIQFQLISYSLKGQNFRLKGIRREYISLFIPLLGDHQLINAATSIGVIELLEECGVFIPPEAISRGLREVKWPGRIQILSSNPFIIVDSAHNAASAQALANTLKKFFPERQIILILGMLKGKDVEGVGKALCPLAEEVVLTGMNSFRSLSPLSLQGEIKKFHGGKLTIKENIKEALDYSRTKVGNNDLICITGSIYLAGEALKLLGGEKFYD